jgi:hypothetical protein
MWWLFGLINVIFVLLSAWFYDKKVKEGRALTSNDKIAFGLMLVLEFLSGFLGTLVVCGIFIYLIVDFVKFVKNNGKNKGL